MPAHFGFELAALKIARFALSTQMSIARRTSASVAFSVCQRKVAASPTLTTRAGSATKLRIFTGLITLTVAVAVIGVNLLLDVVYHWADPRIRLE